MRSTQNPKLHRFAVLVAACTLLLLIAGALVTSTGSGLAVPDWPLSYGMLFPPMVGGILYEHGHRMIAGAVAIMTAVLAVWVSLRDARRYVRILAGIAFVAVILQAVLGGLTVIFLLPTAISVSHLSLAMGFFGMVLSLAVFTSPSWEQVPQFPTNSAILHRLTLLAALAVYAQTVLGAWVRHAGAGLAIPDFPMAYRALIPSFGPESLELYNRWLIYDLDLPPTTSGQIALHFAHRVGAVVTTLIVLALIVETFRRYRHERVFVTLATALAVLLPCQIALGAATVWLRKGVLPTTAHVAVGALMFASTLVYLLQHRKRCIVVAEPAVSATTAHGSRA